MRDKQLKTNREINSEYDIDKGKRIDLARMNREIDKYEE